MSSTPTVVYLAEGKLYILRDGQKPQLIESTFAQQILDRAERSRERNDWKSEGMTWNFASAGMAGLATQIPAEVRRIRFTGVTLGPAGFIHYALDTDYVGGLFEYDLAQGYERRLFHRNGFRVADLSRHPADGMLAFSLQSSDGTARITVLEASGRGLREVTEGDCVDEAPAWVPGDGRRLVFQSAGVGRNDAGFRVALSSYAIQQLDMDSGEVKTLLEDDGFDYLLPRLGADGSLYCIRRPYQPHGPGISPWRVALDIVLFPVRLARAIVHFLNFFSVLFSRKPLITSGGPPERGPDARYLMLFGKVIDAQKILNKTPDGKPASLVPDDWELLRVVPDQTQTVLHRGVLAFDLCPDGSIVHTNGGSIGLIGPAGEKRPLADARLIERVIAAL